MRCSVPYYLVVIPSPRLLRARNPCSSESHGRIEVQCHAMEISVITLVLLLTSAIFAQSPRSGTASVAITDEDVLTMLKDGLSPQVVMAKIKISTCRCDTSPAALAKLKNDGVPDAVILALVESSVPPLQEGLADINQAKTAHLANRSTDNDVFNHLAEKLEKWGRWKLVERPEDADIVVVFSATQVYVGSITSGSVYGTPT